MGKEEESPQVTRRTTRHSSTPEVEVEVETKPIHTKPPTLNSLLHGGGGEEKPISLEDVLSSFPGRKSQILELMRSVGPTNCPMLPLFIYGGASAGKTSVTLQTFRHLNRPFVYSSCLTCYSPRVLFESILNQLLLHRKNEANGYSSAKRCEKPSDFVNLLREALVSVVASLLQLKSGSKKSGTKAKGNMIYLIFDNLELVRDWDKSILPFLFNLYDILKMPEVGFIFISNASPDTYYSSMGYLEPIPLYFPDYSEEDLRQIFMRNQENKKLYSSFLDLVLRPFFRITRRVDELSTALSRLFEKYCEPLSDRGAILNEETRRRLFSNLQPHIAPYMNEIFKVSSKPSLEIGDSKEAKRRSGTRKSGSFEVMDELDLHMSTSAKYLLLSVFLASRNPATLDASLFDSTGGSDNRKRKRKPSEKSLEQKEIAEQELLMKGPGTFPLERLLAIFQCIASVAESSFEKEEEEELANDELRGEGGGNNLMSDVLLQLSSLCNANYIVKGGSCPLESSTRYRATISEDMALKVARSLKFPLSKYLYRR